MDALVVSSVIMLSGRLMDTQDDAKLQKTIRFFLQSLTPALRRSFFFFCCAGRLIEAKLEVGGACGWCPASN